MTALSCGVLVTDGQSLLLGHATRSPRWDIPKGLAEAGEAPEQAARRELLEETGLVAGELEDLGWHAYRRDKALHLFAWRPGAMPKPGLLRCTAMVVLPDGTSFPEFDRFGLFGWDEVGARTGKAMAAVLAGLRGRLS